MKWGQRPKWGLTTLSNPFLLSADTATRIG
jgi:hypothetical protein